MIPSTNFRFIFCESCSSIESLRIPPFPWHLQCFFLCVQSSFMLFAVGISGVTARASPGTMGHVCIQSCSILPLHTLRVSSVSSFKNLRRQATEIKTQKHGCFKKVSRSCQSKKTSECTPCVAELSAVISGELSGPRFSLGASHAATERVHLPDAVRDVSRVDAQGQKRHSFSYGWRGKQTLATHERCAAIGILLRISQRGTPHPSAGK